MAATGAVLLIIAAALAVILRVRKHTQRLAATPSGSSRPDFWSLQNKYVGVAVVAAFLAAFLLFVMPDIGWWGVIPLLISIFASSILMGMAIDWPRTSFGDWAHPNIWGATYLVDDPDVDERLDPSSPNYDPMMDEASDQFDEAYFKRYALRERGTRYGVYAYFTCTALVGVVTVVAMLAAAVMSMNPGDFGGATLPGSANGSGSSSVASSDTGSKATSPRNSSSPGKPRSETTLDDATCEQIKEALPAFDAPVRRQYELTGIERCTGVKSWGVWATAPSGMVDVVVSHSYGVDGSYHYMLIKVQGEEVLIRTVP